MSGAGTRLLVVRGCRTAGGCTTGSVAVPAGLARRGASGCARVQGLRRARVPLRRGAETCPDDAERLLVVRERPGEQLPGALALGGPGRWAAAAAHQPASDWAAVMTFTASSRTRSMSLAVGGFLATAVVPPCQLRGSPPRVERTRYGRWRVPAGCGGRECQARPACDPNVACGTHGSQLRHVSNPASSL